MNSKRAVYEKKAYAKSNTARIHFDQTDDITEVIQKPGTGQWLIWPNEFMAPVEEKAYSFGAVHPSVRTRKRTKNIFSWPFKVVCHAEWSASKVFDFEWSNEWLWMVGWMASWMVTKNGIRFWILILINLMVSQHGIRLSPDWYLNLKGKLDSQPAWY